MTPVTVPSSENTHHDWIMDAVPDKEDRSTRLDQTESHTCQLPASLQHLAKLKDTLNSDPTNIDVANRYWDALGSVCGHDVRNGGFVIEAFRGCALASRQGVIVFCHAFNELFEKTGERPCPELFDEELLRALESQLYELSIFDSSLACSILRSARNGSRPASEADVSL